MNALCTCLPHEHWTCDFCNREHDHPMLSDSPDTLERCADRDGQAPPATQSDCW